MDKKYLALAAFGLSAASAHAGGLDRSGQSVASIFNNTGATLSFGATAPKVTGTDDLGNSYDVGQGYSSISASYTRKLTDQFTIGVIFDQPFGADVRYNNAPSASMLGGTGADLSSEALSFVAKYKVTDRFSVFGGLKAQNVRADVDLNGLAYQSAISVSAVASGAGVDSTTLGAALLGDPNAVTALGGLANVAALGAQVTSLSTAFGATGGYSFNMDTDTSPGGLIGVAYEIPDIALRFAATYHFEMDHTSDTTENLFGMTVNSTVDYKTPQSLNLEFQTGIAADTLLTASYRWTDFSEVDVVPTLLGSDLVNLDDSHRFTIGVARRFNENFVGLINLQYEKESNDDLVSPLGPTNGQIGITIGGRYSKDNVNISGGINYTKLGDAQAEVGGQAQASFTGNSALSAGLRIEVKF